MKIIGIAGYKGSGKDTVAARYGGVRVALADWMKRFTISVFRFSEEDVFGPSEYRVLEYAYLPRDWTALLIRAGVSFFSFLSLFENYTVRTNEILSAYVSFFSQFDPAYITPRDVLQKMGTELGRTLENDVWVKEVGKVLLWLKKERFTYNSSRGLFLNPKEEETETAVVPDVRFPNEVEMIHEHGGKVFWIDASKRIPPSGDLHASETSLGAEGCDEIINNNGSLEELVLP